MFLLLLLLPLWWCCLERRTSRLGGHCSVIMAERAKQLAYHYTIADQQLFILLLAAVAASYCKLDIS